MRKETFEAGDRRVLRRKKPFETGKRGLFVPG
jgi:hypothetical protein